MNRIGYYSSSHPRSNDATELFPRLPPRLDREPNSNSLSGEHSSYSNSIALNDFLRVCLRFWLLATSIFSKMLSPAARATNFTHNQLSGRISPPPSISATSDSRVTKQLKRPGSSGPKSGDPNRELDAIIGADVRARTFQAQALSTLTMTSSR
jgi:hypothetical protein